MTQQIARPFDRTTPPMLVTLVLIASVSALSTNIFLPSLPSMAAEFDVSYGIMQLAVSGFLGLTGLLQLVIGPFADRYGRRIVLLWTIGIFAVASVGCMFAPTAGIFLFFRVIQAVVASGVVLSRAIVRDMVPPDQAASQIGYVTMGMALVPMAAPVLGGYLEGAFGWQASFLVMAVGGLAIVVLIWFDLGETHVPAEGGFSAQFRQYPRLLRSRRFWGYTMILAFTVGMYFIFLGGAPFVGAEILGIDPESIGYYFGIISGGFFFGNFISARMSTRLGIARMMMLGSLVALVGLSVAVLCYSAGLRTPLFTFGFIFFVGLGNGMTLPSATSGLLSVNPALAGSASGLSAAIMTALGAGLSAATGAGLSVESGAIPFLMAMLVSAVVAVCFVTWTNGIERVEAAASP